jgi:hypothetical protein
MKAWEKHRMKEMRKEGRSPDVGRYDDDILKKECVTIVVLDCVTHELRRH